MVLAAIFQFVGVGSTNAQEAKLGTLKVRVRRPDGRAVIGIGIEIYLEGWLPDEEELVGSCVVPESGICEFNLPSVVQYSIRFPDGQQLDPITMYAVGHSGINGLGVRFKEDYMVGFVLSKLCEAEAAANWMLVDDTADSDSPTPRIPEGAKEEAQKRLDAAPDLQSDMSLLVVTQTPTGESDASATLLISGNGGSSKKTINLDANASEIEPVSSVSSEGNRHDLATNHGYSAWFLNHYPWILVMGIFIGIGAAVLSGRIR